MISVCLLGASGSIGRQTLNVMDKNQNDFLLVAFSVGERTRIIAGLLKRYPNVKHICIKTSKSYRYYKEKYPNVTFYHGDEGLCDLIKASKAEMVVNALVGFVGLKPSLVTLENNKILCLANKESLVVGGELINNLLKEGKGKLYPIDSEHVAISKCLAVDNQNVDKIILTASGGPFRDLARDELVNVTPKEALKHPNWKMGNKITIDSATMVNKTFEIIEAHYLFNVSDKDIAIKINSNSYVHSIVRYNNGTYRLDVGKPDMRVPIKWALYQGLTPYQTVLTDDLNKIKGTSFMEFDEKRFPVINIAKKVIKEKGIFGAVFNAANEVAVKAFLDGKLSFLGIEEVINLCMERRNILHPNYEQLKKVDRLTCKKAQQLIERRMR